MAESEYSERDAVPLGHNHARPWSGRSLVQFPFQILSAKIQQCRNRDYLLLALNVKSGLFSLYYWTINLLSNALKSGKGTCKFELNFSFFNNFSCSQQLIMSRNTVKS